jgi:hypothetical protein
VEWVHERKGVKVREQMRNGEILALDVVIFSTSMA